MAAIDPVASSTDTTVDIEAFAYELVLTSLFEQAMKKPDFGDSEESSSGVGDQVNRVIAQDIAKGITGFGQ